MLIFRVEHKRNLCDHSEYKEGGTSVTGHGTYSYCPSKSMRNITTPNFGLSASPPNRIAEYERCAVTAAQFAIWTGVEYVCTNSTAYCTNNNNCYQCPGERKLLLDRHPEWSLVAYEVDSKKEGIDWRIDNEQIVFNPAFARRVGKVSALMLNDMAIV